MTTINEAASVNSLKNFVYSKSKFFVQPDATFSKNSKFNYGINTITKSNVEKINNSGSINWKNFLAYLNEFTTVVDYGPDWVKLNITSEKQKAFIFKSSKSMMKSHQNKK